MAGEEVLKAIADKEIKFVDLRFTDTRGKEQHVTMPSSQVDDDMFEDGKMFDGSSIAGWKGINESDMILMPDADTAVMDPFSDEATLILRCDVIEPATMQGYERDPRSLAKRAEAYLKSTGIGRHRLLRSRARVLRLRRRALGCLHDRLPPTRSTPTRPSWNSERRVRRRQHRAPSRRQGRLLPGAAGRLPARPALRHVPGAWRKWVSPSRCITTKSPPPASAKSVPDSTPWCARPTRCRSSSTCRAQRGPRLRQDRHLHAQAAGGRQRQRHARAPVAGQGRQEPVRR